MIYVQRERPRILRPVNAREWRESSLSQRRNGLGHPAFAVRFWVSASTQDGREVWRGWFEDRDEADAFLTAAVMNTLRHQRALHDLPRPHWSPGWYPDELIVWNYATVNYITSGTTWTVPTDWDDSTNTIECVGAGAAGRENTFFNGHGGGGGGYAKAVNQSYTEGANRTCQIGVGGTTTGQAGTATFLKQDDNSTNAINANGGTNTTGGTGSVGSTTYNGGNGGTSASGGGGGGGGCASGSANGSNGGNSSGASGGAGGNAGTGGGTGGAGGAPGTAGNAGTNFGSGYGSGGGGGAGNSSNAGGNGGAYGGGGGAEGSSAAGAVFGVGAAGLIVITYTPLATGGKPIWGRAKGL